MKKSFLFVCLGLIMTICSFAQSSNEVSFSVQVSYHEVGLNEQFNVTYTLKNTQVVGQFVAPEFRDFTLVAGPMISQQVSVINGNRTNATSYTYTLQPNQLGTAWIPMATIETTAGFFSTQEIAIEVVESTDRPNVTQGDQFFGNDPFQTDPFFQNDPFEQLDDLMLDEDQPLNFQNTDEYLKDAKKRMQEHFEKFNERIEESKKRIEKELEKREKKKSEGKTYRI